MIPSYLSPLANHLWQSTLFAAVAGLFALALKKNRAQVRHGLWLAASVKFLIPFSLLVSIGGHFGWPAAPSTTQPGVSVLPILMEQISQPFALPGIPVANAAVTSSAFSFVPWLLMLVWLVGCASVLLFLIVGWRRIRTALHAASPIRDGHELESLRRLERNAGIRNPIRLLSSPAALEPGVFGILRPVLLLPSGISEHLTDPQLEAILAHELAHVRRRDNLAAAFHMLVEAVFWFHPLVWWLGARLVDERERACDEEVLRMGSDPEAYAEGILQVCEFYLQSPLAYVSGVSGADLKKRIETIMKRGIAQKLDLGKKLLLATVAMAAIAGPVVVGLLSVPRTRAQSPAAAEKHAEFNEPPLGRAQSQAGVAAPQTQATAPESFEVASIKPSAPDSRMMRMMGTSSSDGRYTASNVTVKMLIQQAYDLKDYQISGGPTWLTSDRYDIVAKAETPNIDHERLKVLLQSLLAERFKIQVHRETKELPIYALVVGKNGPKLHESEVKPSTPGGAGGASAGGGTAGILSAAIPRGGSGGGKFSFQMAPISTLVSMLSQQLGRVVLDKTGLTGKYDITLEYALDETQRGMMFGGMAPPATDSPLPADTSRPSIFTAVQEQLGLKLEATKGPVETLVIDHLEKPSGN